MKTRISLFILIPLLWLPYDLPAAVVVSRDSYSNATSDDDSVSTGDAVTGTSLTGGSTSSSASSIGADTSEIGARFYGAVSGRGVSNIIQEPRGIQQSINLTFTWVVTALETDVYDFILSTALHGYLNILDDFNDEANDLASLSTFSSSLSLNGGAIPDTLELSGGSRTTVGSSTVNDTATQNLIGLSGDNTITLNYTATAEAIWKIAGIQNNRTADAVLWGQDGTMNGDSFSDTFDNYSSSSARTADGLFVSGYATLTDEAPPPAPPDEPSAVPEPATVFLLGMGSFLVWFIRRRWTLRITN